MLETNVKKNRGENKAQLDLKTETKGDDNKKEIRDTSIRIMYVQSKACRVNPVSFKGKMNYAIKEANDAKLAQKQDKGHVIYLKEQTEKTILEIPPSDS